ncbi:MAG: FAD:protein FMN transferase [Oscillospiraceae bacterium]|nr:FAD:protein FMN transferase [Oscillospiraceae bacterium]
MKFKKIIILLLLSVFLTGCSPEKKAEIPEEPAVRDLFAMDTYMNLKVWCADGDTALDESAVLISDLEKLFSVTNPDSDTSRINQNAGNFVDISDHTANLLQEAMLIGSESHGALDITVYPVLKEWGFTTGNYQVPDDDTLKNLLSYVDYTQIQLEENQVRIPEHVQIDFGSLAKGYTSDQLIALYKSCQAESAIVNLGGNVQALGRKPDGSLWTVGIVNPFAPDENFGIVKIENQAVITSGNYERYFISDDGDIYWHILDPKDGYPADNGLLSVTIIGESGLLCDGLSTALFAEGTEQAVQHYQKSDNFEMILVTDTGKILLSEGIQENFQNLSSFPVEVISHET